MIEAAMNIGPRGGGAEVDPATRKLGKEILGRLTEDLAAGGRRTDRGSKVEGKDTPRESDVALPFKIKQDMDAAKAGTQLVDTDAGEEDKVKRSATGEQARNFLKLKGVPTSALEGMSDDELTAWRANVLERDNSSQSNIEEINRLRAENQALSEAAKGGEPGDGASPDLDLTERLKPLIESGDISGAAAETLSEVLQTQSKTFQDRIEKLERESIKPLQEQTAAAEGAEEARLMDAARAELRVRYPGVDEPETFKAVSADMATLAKSFRSVAQAEGLGAATVQLMEKALRANGQVPVDKAEQERLAEERRSDRRAGQPDNDNTHNAPREDDAAAQHRNLKTILRKHRHPTTGWKHKSAAG